MQQIKEKLLAYWNQQGQKEQQIIAVVSVFVVLSVFYLAFINPLVIRSNEAKEALDTQKQLAAFVGEKVSQIKALQEVMGDVGSSADMPLNQAVTSSVGEFNLQIVRLQPQQDDLQVWLQPVPFNRLLSWLDVLQKEYAITVKFIEVDKGNASGIVEVKRLQLGRS